MNNTTMVRLHTGNPEVGTLRLWVPEAIASNTGFSAVYPVGTWEAQDCACAQTVSREGLIGPGSFRRVDEKTLESLGRRIPVDSPVEWTTRVSASGDAANFSIALRNLGGSLIHKAGTAICLRFLDATWWSIDNTFVLAQGKLVPLAVLDDDGQEPREYQAYLVNGQSYDNTIYVNGWHFSRHTVDQPLLVSQNTEGGVCVVIHAKNAYFVHRNMGPDGPCTDIMIALGDIAPGEMAEAGGRVSIEQGRADHAVKVVYSTDNHSMER